MKPYVGSLHKDKCITKYDNTSLKWLHSKQPKLGVCGGLCACAVGGTYNYISLMLLKGFLSDSFIYFMYRMFR